MMMANNYPSQEKSLKNIPHGDKIDISNVQLMYHERE